MNNLKQLQETLKTSSTVFYIDPPSGWKYGFPKTIDLRLVPLTKQWLVDMGYPKKDAGFALEHVRLWAKE